jgi:hypothetical protein
MLTMGQTEAKPVLDDGDPNAMIKAYYLFFFAKYAEWPAETQSGKFDIAIYGNEDVYQELVLKYAAQQIGSQTIGIRQIDTLSEIQSPHILFVGRDVAHHLTKVSRSLAESNTMIVTHKADALKLGAMTNFIIVDAAVRYEVNQQLANEKGITFGNKLIQFAIDP